MYTRKIIRCSKSYGHYYFKPKEKRRESHGQPWSLVVSYLTRLAEL